LDDFNDDGLDPEQLRREIFDAVLKKRIFLADRIEKVEKVLVSLNLIPKDSLFCSPEGLLAFKDSL
jgi:hypothetical protein